MSANPFTLSPTVPFQPIFNYPNNKMYQYEAYPVLLSCNFVVDSTNNNGLGIRNLKGNGIANIFMNTSPAASTATSVFASGVSFITLSTTAFAFPGQTITDSTTGGNITAGTKIVAINYATNSVQLSKPTAGASASSPGDTMSFVFTTTGTGNYGVVNPNPNAGIIVVQFQNQFNRYLSGWSGFVSPLTGSNLTSTTAGTAYVIVSLGTATLAQWQAAGFPQGLTPALGASFVATATGSIGGSAAVKASGVSGITSIEVIGDPNQTLQNTNLYQYGGGQMVLQCLGATNSSTTTLIPTAPTNNSVIGLNFYLSNSSVSVNGQ
jgi:hypothetical protein